MRSYYEHLQQTAITPDKKPIFRSSAIFPVFKEKGISCRIIFLGYWLLKRKISDITATITLRSIKGQVLIKRRQPIEKPLAYRIELDDLLTDHTFEGSLEIEFRSSKNMVFPFPAVSINYYGPAFSSVVHSAQHIYNDAADMQANSQSNVPESGFNIHADDNHEPIIGLINGSEETTDAHIDFTFYHQTGKTLQHTMLLGTLAPYETRFLYPARDIDLKTFLCGTVGGAKMQFQLNGIFPRLMVGNRQKKPEAIVITHSYYDCSQASSESDYWKETEEEWYPANLMIPFRQTSEVDTRLYFYPIYSPSSFTIDIEIYQDNGKCLGKKQQVVSIKTPPQEMIPINLSNICHELNIRTTGDLGVRLMAKTPVGERIPARIKLAIDIGQNQKNLPCNFCTNMQPFNPDLESKPQSFRWVPILADQPNASTWIMNSSPKKKWNEPAKVQLTFYREADTATIEREVNIPPHGFLVIKPDQDEQLAAFFQKQVGWLTAKSNQPYTTTYYFVEHPSGVVGGDHGF